MTAAKAISLLKRLPPAERILAVQQLWDSLAEDVCEISLTPAQVGKLDQRICAFHKNPMAGSTWAKVKSRILAK